MTTAIQTYEIWPLLQNFCVYAEFREIPRKHRNSAAMAKFRGSARNSVACGELWALIINIKLASFSIHGKQQISKNFSANYCIKATHISQRPVYWLLQQLLPPYKKVKVPHTLLPSVGPRADRGAQAVSL